MGQFRFQLWSDLHLEICDLQLPENYVAAAPNLILAGDIGIPGSALYSSLLRKVAAAHENVFVVAGNHEYYSTSIEAGNAEIQAMCTTAGPNVYYLNDVAHDMLSSSCDMRLRVVGTTLWSHVKAHQKMDVACFISDHRRIHGWSVSHNNYLHARHVEFLETEILRAMHDDVQLVVVTHHAPLEKGVCKPNQERNALSSAFQTDLSKLMGLPVVMWCFGHTHHCSSQFVKETHVVSNQRGYVRKDGAREDAEFDLNRVFQA